MLLTPILTTRSVQNSEAQMRRGENGARDYRNANHSYIKQPCYISASQAGQANSSGTSSWNPPRLTCTRARPCYQHGCTRTSCARHLTPHPSICMLPVLKTRRQHWLPKPSNDSKREFDRQEKVSPTKMKPTIYRVCRLARAVYPTSCVASPYTSLDCLTSMALSILSTMEIASPRSW